jgi:peptide/nickel transport system permease protein
VTYLSKRLLASALHLVAISAAAFALTSLAPGDAFSESRFDPQMPRETVERIRAQWTLDRPWPQRYATWLSGLVTRADAGTSFTYGLPVTTLIAPRLHKTLAIVAPAWILSWILGLALAALAVRLRIWRWLEGLAAALQTIPEVITASLWTWILLVYWRVSPDSPTLTVAPVILGLLPVVFLHSAGALQSARNSRFAQLATPRFDPTLLWRGHLLPSIANPLISLLGPTLVAAFGSSLVVEAVTGWPGLGTLFLEAFKSRDYPITQAVLLFLGAALTFVNLLADLLLYRTDPRIRVQ